MAAISITDAHPEITSRRSKAVYAVMMAIAITTAATLIWNHPLVDQMPPKDYLIILGANVFVASSGTFLSVTLHQLGTQGDS